MASLIFSIFHFLTMRRAASFCISKSSFPQVRVPERQARLTKILKDAFDDKPKPKLVAIRAAGLEQR